MIIYFTGTGNSLYIAKKISTITGDELLSANERIKSGSTAPLPVSGRLIFVLPTYAWRIPKAVEGWIDTASFPGAKKAWFIMNCGSEIGNAAFYIHRLCERKGFEDMGVWQLIMPENYIAMFSTPTPEEAKRIIAAAEPGICKAGEIILSEKAFPKCEVTPPHRFLSRCVNPLFYRFCITAKPFRVTDQCTACGKCAQLCPVNNIHMDGHPVWGKDCIHCMACIAHCPTRAIEYGCKSIGKPRYAIDERGI